MIKKTKFLIIIAITLVLVNCSSDDDSNEGIEGTWTISELRFGNNYDFNNDGVALENVFDETNCPQEDTIVFNSDGTGSINSDDTDLDIDEGSVATQNPDGSITITYIYESDCLVDSFNEFQIPFTWTQNGNTISVMTAFGESSDLQLNGNRLSLVVEDSYDIPLIVDGEIATQVVNEDATLIYTK